MLPVVDDEPGPPRRPPSRRLLWVLPGAAAVALVVGVLQAEEPPAPPRTEAVAGAPLPELDEPSGARLLALTDDGFVLVDVDLRVSLPVDLPPPGRPGAVVERRGAAVVVSAGRAWAMLSTAHLVELGAADAAFASEAPDRVWLATADGVREVGLDGAVLRQVPGVPATAAAGGGLVVSASGGMELHDAGTGALVHRVGPLPPLVDAGGPWVVAADREELRCEVEVVDARSGGRRRTVRVAPYRTCLQGRSAVSPDGRLLALPVAEYVHGQGTRHGRLVLVELASGRVTTVPRTERPVPIFSSLTWSPSGEWLFWADPVGGQPLAAHRLGGDGAVALRPAGLAPGSVRGVWAIVG
ncbi:MAG TPA: hypothetical protein VHF47_14010 [Acidimicrobiales bacterium]|nr:hypothetical protein [Acidimicrobiales bacterium]